MTGFTLDSTEDMWPHQVKLTLPNCCVFPSVRVVLSVTSILGFIMYMYMDFQINGRHTVFFPYTYYTCIKRNLYDTDYIYSNNE